MKKLLLTTVILFSVFLPEATYAARLYIMPGKIEGVSGDIVEAAVRLDAQQDSTNTVEIKVEFPDDLLEFVSFRDGGSLVNIWIEKPQLTPVTECKTGPSPCALIIMSGIIPGGFTGDGLVAVLEFRIRKDGNGKLDFLSDSKIFADSPDGKTLFTVSNPGEIRGGVPGKKTSPPEDLTPPEDFTVHLEKDPSVAEDKWFVAFATSDKNSGIDHYEVRERTLGIFGGEWKTVDSPYYILENQSLFSAITVRAVNKSGLSHAVTVFPARLKIIYGTAIGLFFVAGLYLTVRFVIRRFPINR